MWQSPQWVPMEFRQVLYELSEVLHASPFNEVVKSKLCIRQQWHHVIGILIICVL